MLVVVVVVQIAAVLVHSWINTKRTWIYLLASHAVRLKFAINISFFLAMLILDPDILYICAMNDVVPLTVWSTGVLFGHGEPASLGYLLGEH